jgi:hypothetical protein
MLSLWNIEAFLNVQHPPFHLLQSFPDGVELIAQLSRLHVLVSATKNLRTYVTIAKRACKC